MTNLEILCTGSLAFNFLLILSVGSISKKQKILEERLNYLVRKFK